MNTSLLEQPDT